VSHPSLKDSAADYLREQILTGRLTPGTKIDQDEISEALGVTTASSAWWRGWRRAAPRRL
jgi:DNA-binding GntR family transcriptional regulator